jgi:hypothetical protein
MLPFPPAPAKEKTSKWSGSEGGEWILRGLGERGTGDWGDWRGAAAAGIGLGFVGLIEREEQMGGRPRIPQTHHVHRPLRPQPQVTQPKLTLDPDECWSRA